MNNSRLHWQIISGQPLLTQALTLTPQSQAVVVRFRRGAWIWHRPTAILVERNGQVERLPIRDLTRRIQLGLFSLTVAMAAIAGVMWLARRAQRPQQKQQQRGKENVV
ncbi:MAG TPA: hypothetical protein VKQ36_02285 [Ktedonobacterales bacterium]|nr:hypothetical protein [Ktedonobacterales bacterium]